MAHGLSAVREMFLDRYAEAFAEAGLTTLVYDHFGFGASDGVPRQCPAPSVQLEGYRDAIAWLGGHPSVDPGRIGIWGSSFSGGEVINLASEDLPIGCAVAQVPALGEGGPDLPVAALAAINEAVEEGSDDAVLPAVTATSDGLGVMYEDGSYEWFTRVAAERAPSWRNELRVEGLLEPFRPIDHLADARVPLLLVVAARRHTHAPWPSDLAGRVCVQCKRRRDPRWAFRCVRGRIRGECGSSDRLVQPTLDRMKVWPGSDPAMCN